MPRKNNRKSYEYEDRLGFNPNRYLVSSHSNRFYGSTDAHSEAEATQTVKAAPAAKRTRRALYETKPSLDRHKAHSSNRRKRRAMYTIRKMQRSADRAQRKTTAGSYEMICMI